MDEKILYFVDKFCEESLLNGNTGFIDNEMYVYKDNTGTHRIYKNNEKPPNSMSYFARYCSSYETHILIILDNIKFRISNYDIKIMTVSTGIFVVIEDESDLFNHSLNDNTVLLFSTLKRLQEKLYVFNNEYRLKIYGDEL